jgi:hypothetical protein
VEHKFANIDKINSKIRKILDSLNEEEKRITQNHLKIGSKRMAAHSYTNRIRNPCENEPIDNAKRNDQPNDLASENLYDKFVEIREKHRVGGDKQSYRSALGEIQINNRERGERREWAQQSIREETTDKRRNVTDFTPL